MEVIDIEKQLEQLDVEEEKIRYEIEEKTTRDTTILYNTDYLKEIKKSYADKYKKEGEQNF